MSRMTDFCDIACDVCGQWEPGTEPGTRAQRAVLKEKGWTLRGTPDRHEDVCPACNRRNPHYWGFAPIDGPSKEPTP